ncbi:MAG TPA: hypothetical protein VIL91_05620 [Gaiellaceae bacterium]
MRSRLTKLGAALVALAALAVGGSALASASGGGSSPAKAPAGLKQQAPPAADAESNDSAAESGSETPGNDGPGGHADEPGNPNADTEQQGEH